MCQEGDVLLAAAHVLHVGVRAGQLAHLMPTTVLSGYVGLLRSRKLLGPKRAGSKRDGSPRLLCEAVRVAQLLKRCR
eukprot:1320044-Pleurochrysis_carterae.AAC.1